MTNKAGIRMLDRRQSAGTTERIHLVFFDPTYMEQLERYRLTEDHLRYTSLPPAAISKCELEHDRHPIVVLHHHQVAGFFVLHGWEGVQEYCGNRDAILVRAFSVEASFQGRGIAKQALKLLPAFVKQYFPGKNEIVLAVNEDNAAAQHVYRKAGFMDTGQRVMGRKGPLFVMHLPISDYGAVQGV